MFNTTKQPIYPGIIPEDDPDIEITYPDESSASAGLWAEVKSITRDIIFAAVMAVLIIVFWFPDDPTKSFIKRVIGLPDDSIDMDAGGHIVINGQPVEEPYLAPERNQAARSRWNQGPYTTPGHQVRVKPHYYFVLGDNRDASNDSRSWGLVPEKYIYGKAMFRYWPLPRIGSLNSTVDVDDER